MRGWWWAVAASLACLATYLANSSFVPLTMTHIVGVGASVAAVVAGLRVHRPARPGPWLGFAAALLAFLLAPLVTVLLGLNATPGRAGPWGTVIALSHVIGMVLAAGSGLLMARASAVRGQRSDRDGAIDATIVAIIGGSALWQFVIEPARITLGNVPLQTPAIVLIALMPAAIAAITTRVVFLHPKAVAAWLLLASGVLLLVANSMLLVAEPAPAGSLRYVLWLASGLAVGLAGLHPSMATLSTSSPVRDVTVPYARLCVLGAALLGGQAMVFGATGVTALVPALALVASTGLVLWRLFRLVFQRERARRAIDEARRDAKDRADQLARVASLGQHATSAIGVQELLDHACTTIAEVTGAEAVAILEPPGDDGAVAQRGGGAVRVLAATDAWPATDGEIPSRDDLTAAGFALFDIPVVDDREYGSVALLPAAGIALTPTAHEFVASVGAVLAGGIHWRRTRDDALHRALHDPLTDLPNRMLLMDRLVQALAATARSRRRDGSVALLFLDLDGFKQVNDTLGHDAGDHLLRQVAARATAQLRAHETLARWAGDEFVVLLDGVGGTADAVCVAERIRDALAHPFRLPGTHDPVAISASIGVALARPGDHPDTVLHAADAAMYRAKQHRPGAISVVTDHTTEPAQDDTARGRVPVQDHTHSLNGTPRAASSSPSRSTKGT